LSEATAAAEAAEPVPERPEAEPQPVERSGERARGPDGKFLPRAEGAADDDSPAAEAEEAPADPDEEEPEAEAPPAEPTVAVPTHWSPADKDLIGKLPAEYRQAVVDRYKAIEAGYTPKLMRAAELEKQFAGAEEVFKPYAEVLRQRNQTASDVVRAWATVEQGFLEGAQEAQAGRPNQKGALLVANLIRNYQVDPAAVAEILQRALGAAPASSGATVPPELMQEITSLKQWKSETERTIQAGREADAQRQIDAFAAAKDARGNPLYPYFAELEPEIIRLAQVDASERKPLDLADLYDRAAYANRETRAKLLSASAEEQKRQAAVDRKARAAAAQRASSSVTGSAGQSPSEGSRARSLREELEMNAAEHEAA
jgi:hypothetical protein